MLEYQVHILHVAENESVSPDPGYSDRVPGHITFDRLAQRQRVRFQS